MARHCTTTPTRLLPEYGVNVSSTGHARLILSFPPLTREHNTQNTDDDDSQEELQSPVTRLTVVVVVAAAAYSVMKDVSVLIFSFIFRGILML